MVQALLNLSELPTFKTARVEPAGAQTFQVAVLEYSPCIPVGYFLE